MLNKQSVGKLMNFFYPDILEIYRISQKIQKSALKLGVNSKLEHIAVEITQLWESLSAFLLGTCVSVGYLFINQCLKNCIHAVTHICRLYDVIFLCRLRFVKIHQILMTATLKILPLLQLWIHLHLPVAFVCTLLTHQNPVSSWTTVGKCTIANVRIFG